MSIIPFILDGDDRTVVQTREEFEKAKGLDGDVIFIQSLDTSQLRNTVSSNASYDLRVGSQYKDHRDSNPKSLPDGDDICLRPGAAIIIETAEFVQFPKTRFGHIVPKVGLLHEGLSNTSSKVDPGYEGKLNITVFNLGKREIFLKKDQKFCTLYILDISHKDKVIPYRRGEQRTQADSNKSVILKIVDFIELKQAYITAIIAVFTAIIVVKDVVVPAINFISNRSRDLPSQNQKP